MRRSRGFTIVEMLIAVAIIAALIAIVLPVLRTARQAAKDTGELSNLRQVHMDFAAWAADRRGVIANAGSPMESTIESQAYYGQAHGEDRGWGMYLLQGELWPGLLRLQYQGVVPGHWHSRYTEEDMPLQRPEGGTFANTVEGPRAWDVAVQTQYRLGATLLTESQIWTNPGAVTKQRWVRNHAKKVRFSDISAPARKGMIFLDEWPGAKKGRLHVLFCDGSAALKRFSEARPTAVPPFETSGEPGMAVDATFNGYKGVDF